MGLRGRGPHGPPRGEGKKGKRAVCGGTRPSYTLKTKTKTACTQKRHRGQKKKKKKKKTKMDSKGTGGVFPLSPCTLVNQKVFIRQNKDGLPNSCKIEAPFLRGRGSGFDGARQGKQPTNALNRRATHQKTVRPNSTKDTFGMSTAGWGVRMT